MVQVFASLRSAQGICPLDELRPIFRFLHFSNSPFLLEILFCNTNVQHKPMVQVFAPLRSAQGIRPLDEPGPIFRFLTFYVFFYLPDTIQFHLLQSPWRSTGRLRTSKLLLCYHFSKTQQEIFPHHTAAYTKNLRFPVYRLFYSFYNIEVTRS